ncbi:MAG: GGDEF domain-containing protein [Deltaproteobacteria bacterium]|nr:GGDEF domain-containing protein [Deltaproteobacteria bacterium]
MSGGGKSSDDRDVRGARPASDPPSASSGTLPMVDTEFARTVERLRETRPTLLVLAGPILGARLALSGAPTVFGRASDCDVTLPDEGISSRHFEVLLGPDGRFLVRDLGSMNGTLVNGQRISGERRLEPGDRLLVGHTPMRFLLYTPVEDDLLDDLEARALQDPLTGLYNRRYFEQRLAQELQFAIRHEATLTLALLDIDHFKNVNDGWGHPVGDRLLLEVGSYLRGCVRTEDVVVRHGGEEFSILMRETGEAGARTTAERLREGIEAFPFAQLGNRIPITVSIGLAVARGRKGLLAEQLVEAADAQLQRAKQEGRNRVCCIAV